MDGSTTALIIVTVLIVLFLIVFLVMYRRRSYGIKRYEAAVKGRPYASDPGNASRHFGQSTFQDSNEYSTSKIDDFGKPVNSRKKPPLQYHDEVDLETRLKSEKEYSQFIAPGGI